MSIGTKLHLSKLETELIRNKEWILTKHAIINKVYKLFGELNEIYKQISQQEETFLPEFYKNTRSKISKGENYEGLPYVMLDYPATRLTAHKSIHYAGCFYPFLFYQLL